MKPLLGAVIGAYTATADGSIVPNIESATAAVESFFMCVEEYEEG